jgi:hypothetical protein
MALHHLPRITTDGLVLCLDAGNPLGYAGLGPELVTNSDLLVADDGNYDTINNSNSPICYTGAVSTAGKTYQVSWKVLARRGTTSATLRMNLAGISNSINFNTTPGILNTSTVTIPNSSILNIVADNTGVDFDLDYVSIRELPTSINDLSGNSTNGTLINGPTFSSSNGGSLVFDGNDDVVEITNFPQIFSGSICMCGWFYFNENNARDVLFGNYDGTGDINFEKYTSNRLRLWWNSGTNDVFSSDNVVSAGIWQYITIQRNKENQTFDFYVNENLVSQSNVLSADVSNSRNTYRIGRDIRTGVTALNGNVSQISIYSRALSANEINQNYLATKGRYGL